METFTNRSPFCPISKSNRMFLGVFLFSVKCVDFHDSAKITAFKPCFLNEELCAISYFFTVSKICISVKLEEFVGFSYKQAFIFRISYFCIYLFK